MTDSDYLLHGRRLYQEWQLCGYTMIENQRLRYLMQNQATLRADTYQNVREAIETRSNIQDSMYHNEAENTIGRIILPSSYTGSPRYYNEKFQDAMAILRKYHKPDLFITMTCNPQWPEIKNNLVVGQYAQDRPDLVARVFKLRKDALMKDLVQNAIFGRVLAYLYVTEFQKRGLPHVHILLILAEADRPKTSDQVDSIVTAELPPSPHDPGLSEEEQEQRKSLWDIVLSNMVHGPCGSRNPRSPCMKDGKCTKNFPKAFQKETFLDPERNHPVYRRRSPEDGGVTGILRTHVIDSSIIVPYNVYLSSRYSCHINVEICCSPMAAKYLYKYVTKGPDRAMVSIEAEDSRNEIKQYHDMRSVGSGEAAHRLFDFHIAENKPAVMALRLHLENQQHVTFVGGQEQECLEQGRETELTAFFKFNQEEKEAKGDGFNPSLMPMYIEMPEGHVITQQKWWKI